MFRRNVGVDFGWVPRCVTMYYVVATLYHTLEPRYFPVLTCFIASDTGKFSYFVLRYVSLPPRCSLAVATLCYAVPRCISLLPRNNLMSVLGNIYAPVIQSRFGRYVVPTLLTPTFRKKSVLISAGCHVVSRCTTLLPLCSHAGATLLSSVDTLDK